MTILIVLTVLTLVGVFISSHADYEVELIGILISALSGIGLLIALIALPIARMDSLSGLARLESIKHSMESARTQEVTELERATAIRRIVGANEWLASTQYYNSTVFDIWINDAVMEAEPVR